MPIWSIKSPIRPPLLVMVGIEALILYSSLYVAGLVVFGNFEESRRLLGPMVPKAMLVAAVILLSLVAMGLYQLRQRLYFREAVVRLLVGFAFGSLGLAVVFYFLPSTTVSHHVAGVAAGYSLALLLLVRYVFVRTVDENVFRSRVLVFGAGQRAGAIEALRRRADRRGFKVVAQVAAPGDTIGAREGVLTTNGKTITDFAVEKGADEIVVAMDDRRGNLPVRELLNAKLKGVAVIDLLEFLERESGKIRIDLVNPGWLIFSPGFQTSRLRRVSKRIVDLLVSAALLLVAWPVMLLIALAIKLEDGLRAPVLYRQLRVGYGEQLFEVLKFRSMTVDAEADGKPVWAEEDDERVTRVGNCLRRMRLDELPQVFNVLWGQMSIAGPRPERPEFVSELEKGIPYYAARHTVKPGVTGWAQLEYCYGASQEDAIEKLQYDLYYIKNQNLMLDLLIILRTVEVVLWGKGAR